MRKFDNEDWENIVKTIVCLGILYLAFFLTGCASAPRPVATGAATYQASWDTLIAQSITPAMRRAVPGSLCPQGAPNPESFWAALFRATSYAESGWNQADVYTEKFSSNAGAPQKSQGMMQLSLDDSSRGPHCHAINQSTILSAEPNFLCAVDIMDELIRAAKFDTLRQNLGRYWSTIRDSKVDAMMQDLLPSCFKAETMEMTDMGEAK